jgi:putative tryptophan/tyrosine transport system substrate-binding protein
MIGAQAMLPSPVGVSGGAVKRRDFITLVGGAAMWPLAARAQQAMPVIGLLGLTSFEEWKRYVAAFHQGLGEGGFVAGRNVAMEYRWADGHYDRLPALAADLVARKVNVIVTVAPPAALAAKAATTTIPIVFFMGSDPLKLGLIASFNRPGGNITGVTALANAIDAKRLQLLHEVVPQSKISGFLVNPTNQNAEPDTKEMQTAADALGQRLVIAKASADADIDAAFAAFMQAGAGGLVVNPDPFLLGRRDRITMLAARAHLPTIFHTHEPVEAGGLMSYGASFPDAHRQAGVYAARVLKGEKPADLPVPQASKFEMVINLNTARALGITVPPSLLGTADQVIE